MNPPENPPSPADDSAARAAAWHDWQQLMRGFTATSLPADSDPEEKNEGTQALISRIEDFLTKHTRLISTHGTGCVPGLDPVLEKVAAYHQADADVEAAEQHLLHAAATAADAQTALNIACLERLAELNDYSDDKWDSMPYLDREALQLERDALREHRDSFLAQLPIDLRREWERKA